MPKKFILENTNIHLIAPASELNFLDSQTIMLSKSISPLEAWALITSKSPAILKFAFKTRDIISNMFGVKSISGFKTSVPKTVKIGDKLDFFLVEHVDENTLSLTERDKHLDTMTCITTTPTSLTITSSVIIHNFFGKIYMLPVAPAHKIIVRSMLNRIG